MRIFVGLDCGGSSSRVLAVSENGERLFQGSSGAANLLSTAPSKLRQHLLKATDGCPTPDFVCGCFAGLIDAEQRTKAISLLREIFPAAQLRTEPDYVAALYATPPGTDVCVIAGTGSLVASRTPLGVVKSGGRGYLLGDEGSGFQFGRAALRHYLADPAAASPALQKAVAEAFHTEVESEIVTLVHRSASPAGLVAKVAKALGPDLRNGLDYAVNIVEAELPSLARVVSRHAAKYHAKQSELNICVAGGVWTLAKTLRDRFHQMLAKEMPHLTVQLGQISRAPQEGAVELAKEMTTEISIGN
jgi:N-acetylglucosamine kinase-like BadF-type ATPase